MFQAGASGYLTKDDAPEKIVEAIQIVNSGKKYTNGLSAEVLGGTLKDQNN
jgi:DNA-binding NarL/FixJ family response regulator